MKASPHPIPDSYWVLPGKLLAGEYPGSRVYLEPAHSRLNALLEAGVDCFIDLTRQGELPDYSALLQEEAASLGKEAQYLSFPIGDFSIPTVEGMKAVLDAIDHALESGRVVYVHCWAGIGRTGTTVGCYLVRHGMSGEEALQRIAALRRDIPSGTSPSPESRQQWDFVLNWQAGQNFIPVKALG
jgi:protein-tyrosine phosphatase